MPDSRPRRLRACQRPSPWTCNSRMFTTDSSSLQILVRVQCWGAASRIIANGSTAGRGRGVRYVVRLRAEHVEAQAGSLVQQPLALGVIGRADALGQLGGQLRFVGRQVALKIDRGRRTLLELPDDAQIVAKEALL